MKLKGLLKVALVLLAISTMFVACDTLAGGKFPPIFTPFTPEAGTVYVQMPETWLGNEAYGAWIWADGGNGSWYDLEVVDESEGIFSCDVPADKQNIIFVAFTSETKDWANKKEQTADLKIPTDGNVLYVIQSSSWVDPTGKAEIPEPPAEPEGPTPADLTSLAGTMNGWNAAGDINEKFYAKGGDQFAITNGTWDYKFCGVKITALNEEFELIEGHSDNVTFADGVLTVNEWYKIVLRIDGDKVFVKVVPTGDPAYVPPAPPANFFEPADIIGDFGEMNFTTGEDNAAVAELTYNSSMTAWGGGNGKVNFAIREIAGSWDAKWCGIDLTIGSDYVELKKNDNANATISGLEDGKTYIISVKYENNKVYAKVAVKN